MNLRGDETTKLQEITKFVKLMTDDFYRKLQYRELIMQLGNE